MTGTALVGFGWWGRHIAERLSGHDGLRLRAVVEPDAALHEDIRAMGLTPLPDLTAALADDSVQAVILTSPNILHDAQIAEAVAAGRHVFCEKPLSLSAANAQASVDACRDAGLILGIGHERRFEPGLVALRQMLKDGALGTIMHAEMAFSHDKLIGLSPESWRTTKAHAPAAAMTMMGIHLSDLLIALFGPVARLHAITADRSLGWETGDIVTVQMQFEAGMTANLQAILHTPHFIRTHVFGTEAHVEVRNATHPDTPGGVARMEVTRGVDDIETRSFDWTDTVTANLEAWAAAIRGETPYPFTDQELVHNIEVLEAIVRSAETGEAVTLR